MSVLEITFGRRREDGALPISDKIWEMNPLWLVVLFTGVSRSVSHERFLAFNIQQAVISAATFISLSPLQKCQPYRSSHILQKQGKQRSRRPPAVSAADGCTLWNKCWCFFAFNEFCFVKASLCENEHISRGFPGPALPFCQLTRPDVHQPLDTWDWRPASVQLHD